MKSAILGIDTSNYTTSLTLVSETGHILKEARQLLNVEKGGKGLRQSEALFQHVKNLPILVEQVLDHKSSELVGAIASSTKPRPQLDSYMPVFLPGEGLARSLAAALAIPFYPTTHQEGHIWAGVATAHGPRTSRFLAIHLSGGTSELLKCELNYDYSLSITMLGGSRDIHAGQFVDRVGVDLGLNFPCGPELEKLALGWNKRVNIPSVHRGGWISFSGPLTAAQRLVSQENAENIGYGVFVSIARTLEKWIRWAVAETGIDQVLLVGGVAANGIIRAQLEERLRLGRLFFANPRYSVDNSYGVALIGGLLHKGKQYYGHILPEKIIGLD